MVQWLKLRASTAEGVGPIPGQGTKIRHAMVWLPKKKRKERKKKIQSKLPKTKIRDVDNFKKETNGSRAHRESEPTSPVLTPMGDENFTHYRNRPADYLPHHKAQQTGRKAPAEVKTIDCKAPRCLGTGAFFPP